MKKLTFIFALCVAVATFGYAQHQHGGGLSSMKKDPTIAAVLSLQPLPVDLGNFYAGNWERGILYTAAEVALFVPAMVLLSENSDWRAHHRYDSYYYTDADRTTWTQTERERFYYLLGGYMLVKIISAFDAGYTVERQNSKITLGYNENTKSFALSFVLPIH